MPIRVEYGGQTHEFPDTFTDADIAAALSETDSEPAQPAAAQSKFDRDFPGLSEKLSAQDAQVRKGTTAQLAAAGGFLGGIPGAALGGYVGGRVSGKDVSGALQEGAMQGAVQATGQVLPPVLRAGAERLVTGLVKPSKALRDSFGGNTIARTILDTGATVSQRGADKLINLMGLSRNNALQIVRDAEQAGVPGVTARDVTREYAPVARELGRRVDIGQPNPGGGMMMHGGGNPLSPVTDRARGLVKTATRTGGAIPLTKAQTMKETAQDAASGAYRQMERGTVKQLTADDMLDEATARGLKQAIERRVPAVGPANAQTQRLLGASRAMEDALSRNANNNAIGAMKDLIAIGGGAGLGQLTGDPDKGAAAGLLLALLTRPTTGSITAIGLDRLARQPLDQWLRAALASANQEQ